MQLLKIYHNQLSISDKQKYTIFSEMYSLLSAGLSFSQAFELLISTEQKNATILRMLYTKVCEGMELWRSMECIGSFSALDAGVVRIGEETGKLSASLLFLSDYYRKKNVQRSVLTGALSYPFIIILTAILVLAFMITVVIPMFEQVYTRMGGSLPEITLFMLRMAGKFPAFCLSMGFVVMIFVTIRLLWGHTEKYQRIFARLILGLPYIGQLIRMHYQSQTAKLMHLLVSSDVPLLSSLQMMQSIIRFYPFSKSFQTMSEGLQQGDTLTSGLEKHVSIYGRKYVALVRVGEETNRLSWMFERLSTDISMELEHKLKRLGSTLEPILILCIGVIVAFVLIAMYLPMFQLSHVLE